MRAGKLQRLAKREREPEAVNESEAESNRPSPIESGRHDIFERHVHNRDGDQRLDQRWEPQGARNEVEGGRQQCDRMSDRECRNDDDQRPQAPEWNHETQEEEEMIGAVENMNES